MYEPKTRTIDMTGNMTKSWIGVLALGALVGACAPADQQEEAAVVDTAASAAAGGMATMQAKDGNHEFLRMMSDHHEGLIQMATPAMDKASAQTTKDDAHMLHTKQAAERDTMVAMVQREYQEQHTPRPPAKNQAQADSLNALSGSEYDRTFYRLVVEHHREGIGMIDQHMSHLTNPSVRQMAEKMKADQQKEIAEFEQKQKSVS
jgi:uncharacterized protein (DUF305 family)